MKLGFEGFRCFGDTGYLNIAPLTILLGRNSVGKSTILRSLPLLRQSVTTETRSPVLWFGHLVDFGDFATAKSRFSKEDSPIVFKWILPLKARRQGRRLHLSAYGRIARTVRDTDLEVRFSTWPSAAGAGNYPMKLELALFDSRLSVELTDSSGPATVKVNERRIPFPDALGSHRLRGVNYLFPVLQWTDTRSKHAEDELSPAEYSRFFARNIRGLENSIRTLAHGRTGAPRVNAIARSIPLGTDSDMLAAMQDSRAGTDTWKRTLSSINTQDSRFSLVRDMVYANALPVLIGAADRLVSGLYQRSQYIAPVRAQAARYYRQQDLSVRAMEPTGANLPMMLSALSKNELEAFEEWSVAAFGFAVRARTTEGHVSLEVITSEAPSNRINVVDSGFGISQVLPLMLQLWLLGRNAPDDVAMNHDEWDWEPTICAIEQPELHLHPAMQQNVTDALVQLVKRVPTLRFVIETHSQTIVNYLGRLIRDGSLDSDSVNLYLFDRPSSDSPAEIRKASYTHEGALKNWPHGFFGR